MTLCHRLTAVVLAVGCTLSSSGFAETLSLYTWRKQERALWQEINKRNLIPGVTVELKAVNYDSYRSHVLLELQNDKADLFQWAPGAASLKSLIEHKMVEPFRGDLSKMNQSALLASLGPDGEYYGAPFALQLQALIGNAKLLKKNGIYNQPQTLAELENDFETLKSAGVTPLHIAGSANWYMSQLTAEVLMAGLVNEDFAQQLVAGKACFTDARYTEIFAQLKSWQNKGYLNSNALTEDYTGMNNSIGLGNSAMAIEGGWKAGPSSHFYQIDPDYEFAFWALPGNSAKVYALGDGSYQMNANSSRKAAAEKVLQFTATKEFAELFAETVNELPAYGGSLSISQANLRTMSNLVSSNAYSASLFTAYALNRKEPSYNSLVIEALRGVLSGDLSAEQAGQNIQTGLNSWSYSDNPNCR